MHFYISNSFGVLVYELWEERQPDLVMMAEGSQRKGGPYTGRLLRLLEGGERLTANASAADWVHYVLKRALCLDSSDRVAFAELEEYLDARSNAT